MLLKFFGISVYKKEIIDKIIENNISVSVFKIHNGNHKYCNININKKKLKEGRKDETYLVEFDGMLVGKFHIIIFSLLAKTGSVGPVEQLIKLVSPYTKSMMLNDARF